MASMDAYPKAAMERAMKVQDVMLQAMAKKITWWQAGCPSIRAKALSRANLSWRCFKHRWFRQRRLRTKALEHHAAITSRWKIVPPTIDTA